MVVLLKLALLVIETYGKETKEHNMKKSPIKNMAYWKGKNAAPVKQMNVANAAANAVNQNVGQNKKSDPNATIQQKIDAKIEEKVDEVVNNKTGEGLV